MTITFVDGGRSKLAECSSDIEVENPLLLSGQSALAASLQEALVRSNYSVDSCSTFCESRGMRRECRISESIHSKKR